MKGWGRTRKEVASETSAAVSMRLRMCAGLISKLSENQRLSEKCKLLGWQKVNAVVAAEDWCRRKLGEAWELAGLWCRDWGSDNDATRQDACG